MSKPSQMRTDAGPSRGGVTQAGLARRWGLTRQRVNQMAKAGMPLTSVEEAEAWRLVRYGVIPADLSDDRGGKAGREPAETKGGADCDVGKPPVGTVDVATLGRRDLIGARARLQQVEIEAWEVLREAIDRRDSATQTAMRRTYMQHLKDLVSVEKQLIEAERLTGALLSKDEALGLVMEYLEPLRVMLKALPNQLAPRANPGDPELARMVIKEGVERLFRQMHRTEAT